MLINLLSILFLAGAPPDAAQARPRAASHVRGHAGLRQEDRQARGHPRTLQG